MELSRVASLTLQQPWALALVPASLVALLVRAFWRRRRYLVLPTAHLMPPTAFRPSRVPPATAAVRPRRHRGHGGGAGRPGGPAFHRGPAVARHRHHAGARPVLEHERRDGRQLHLAGWSQGADPPGRHPAGPAFVHQQPPRRPPRHGRVLELRLRREPADPRPRLPAPLSRHHRRPDPAQRGDDGHRRRHRHGRLRAGQAVRPASHQGHRRVHGWRAELRPRPARIAGRRQSGRHPGPHHRRRSGREDQGAAGGAGPDHARSVSTADAITRPTTQRNCAAPTPRSTRSRNRWSSARPTSPTNPSITGLRWPPSR